MIKKIIRWAVDQFGPKKDHVIDAWPFPVVLGTPPSCAKACEDKPAKKRPTVKKATTRKPKANVVAKATVKRTTKKKAK